MRGPVVISGRKARRAAQSEAKKRGAGWTRRMKKGRRKRHTPTKPDEETT